MLIGVCIAVSVSRLFSLSLSLSLHSLFLSLSLSLSLSLPLFYFRLSLPHTLSSISFVLSQAGRRISWRWIGGSGESKNWTGMQTIPNLITPSAPDDVTTVRQLGHRVGPCLAHFSRISQPSSTPSPTRRVMGSTQRPRLSNADWRVRSNGLTDDLTVTVL